MQQLCKVLRSPLSFCPQCRSRNNYVKYYALHRNRAWRDPSVRVCCKGDFAEHTDYRGRNHHWYCASVSASVSVPVSKSILRLHHRNVQVELEHKLARVEVERLKNEKVNFSFFYLTSFYFEDLTFFFMEDMTFVFFEDSIFSYFRSALRARCLRLQKSVNCKSMSSKPSKQRWHNNVNFLNIEE